MSNKFTEEQYQEIINFEDFEVVYRLGLVDSFVGDIITFISKNDLQQESMAIANPLTREWAHDKFVEKEKKYVWQSKQETEDGEVKRLYDSTIGIMDSFMEKKEPIHNGNLITETEVKKWGYNPEMFDKEEV